MIRLVTLAVAVCVANAEWGGSSWGGRGWEGGRGGEEEIGRGGWRREEEREIGRGGGGEGGWEGGRKFDHYSPPRYEYNYGVEDPKTGDHKQQREERKGDRVRGEYSFLESDGSRRIVKYEADDKNGFNAKVIKEGPARHPIGRERGEKEGRW